MVHSVAPILIKMVTKYRHEHGPHPEIDPAGLLQTAHAGIHQGEARLPLFPGFNEDLIFRMIEQFVTPVDALGFVAAFYFKLLDKMAMPAQAGLEIVDCRFKTRCFFGGLCCLVNLADAEVAPSEVG